MHLSGMIWHSQIGEVVNLTEMKIKTGGVMNRVEKSNGHGSS